MQVLPFLKNPKDLDLSYKIDLYFWDCFGRKAKLCLITKEILEFSTVIPGILLYKKIHDIPLEQNPNPYSIYSKEGSKNNRIMKYLYSYFYWIYIFFLLTDIKSLTNKIDETIFYQQFIQI